MSALPTIGNYEILKPLSSGGMCDVYLGQQRRVGGYHRTVALKRLRPQDRNNPSRLRMFLREAKICASLNHTHLPQLYELIQDGDDLVMAMEFVHGATLMELMISCSDHKRPLQEGFVVATVLETCRALDYAHHWTDREGVERQIIHRDIAGKNIMVGFDGVTRLLDFGIARQDGRERCTAAGMLMGTTSYMSPEQLNGEPLDPRTDIYALGVVLHEGLTGRPLFFRRTARAQLSAILVDPVARPSAINPSVSPELDEVVMCAISRDRELRFPTAEAFHDALFAAAGADRWTAGRRGALVRSLFAKRLHDHTALINPPLEPTDLHCLVAFSEAPTTKEPAVTL